jgi:hypothetical protein
LLQGLACAPAEPDRAAALASTAAQRLEGVWDASFRLEYPAPRSAPPSPVVRGVIALIENHVGREQFGALGTPLHHGVYDVDFTAYGVALPHPAGLPTAVARTTSGPDSVVILLEPSDEGRSLMLSGLMSRDEIAGVWRLENPSRSALWRGGRFVMRRRDSATARRSSSPE